MSLMVRGFASVAVMAGLLLSAGIAQGEPDEPTNGTFDICVRHNINGNSLGMPKALPVDAYVNGGYVGTLEFKDILCEQLPADTYTIEVYPAGSPVDSEEGGPLMSLGPVYIPAGADISIIAKLSGKKTPVLHIQEDD